MSSATKSGESITTEGPLTLDATCLKMSFESIERDLLDAHNAIEVAIEPEGGAA